MVVFDMPGDCIAQETITPGDTATGITPAVLHPTSGIHIGMTAKAVLITCEDNTVNFTCEGTTPEALTDDNIGHALTAGQSLILRGQNSIRQFQAIDRVSGNAGILKVSAFA